MNATKELRRDRRFELGIMMVLTAGALMVPSAEAVSTWNGTGDWTVSGNWSPAPPSAGDDVVIASGTCTLSADSPALNSLVVNDATLTFSGWDTVLRATTVTVAPDGIVTHNAFVADSQSNRVQIVCSNLTVQAGGFIRASAKGYPGRSGLTGYGPGGGFGDGSGRGGSGGHGGLGGNGATPGGSEFRAGGRSYGLRHAPQTAGSAGGGVAGGSAVGGAGGGVVRIEATGTVTVEGGIDVHGADAPGFHTDGAGAGGSIYIYGHTFSGDGVVGADGGASTLSDGGHGGGGGGGRIAVWCVSDTWGGTMTATKGFSRSGQPVGFDGTVVRGTLAAYGAAVPPSPNEWSGYAYHITLDASQRQWNAGTNWSQWREPMAGEDVMVYTHGSDLASIEMNSATPVLGGVIVSNITLNFAQWDTRLKAASVTVQTNGILTHSAVDTNSVPGVLHRVNVACGAFTLDVGGSVNVDYRGHRGGVAASGQGPGGGASGAGGGYGGKGGDSGANLGGLPYDVDIKEHPLGPGSGGGGVSGASIRGGDGGGSVWIEVPRGTATIHGTISAIGEFGPGNWTAGGGSGGAIYLSCRRLVGTGTLNAEGGGSVKGGGGGGGRIAVWRADDEWAGNHSAAGGAGENAAKTGGVGTAEFLSPPRGTLIVVQ